MYINNTDRCIHVVQHFIGVLIKMLYFNDIMDFSSMDVRKTLQMTLLCSAARQHQAMH